MLWASGDEIASIGGLLTDRWHPAARILNPPMEPIDAQEPRGWHVSFTPG
jgi:hypothetical protein